MLDIVPEWTPTEVVDHCFLEGKCIYNTCGAVMEEMGKVTYRS